MFGWTNYLIRIVGRGLAPAVFYNITQTDNFSRKMRYCFFFVCGV